MAQAVDPTSEVVCFCNMVARDPGPIRARPGAAARGWFRSAGVGDAVRRRGGAADPVRGLRGQQSGGENCCSGIWNPAILSQGNNAQRISVAASSTRRPDPSSAPVPQRIYQQCECRRRLAPARVVKMVARIGRALADRAEAAAWPTIAGIRIPSPSRSLGLCWSELNKRASTPALQRRGSTAAEDPTLVGDRRLASVSSSTGGPAAVGHATTTKLTPHAVKALSAAASTDTNNQSVRHGIQ